MAAQVANLRQRELGEARLNNGVLELDFSVPYDLQRKGLGKGMFDTAVKEFGDEIKAVQGLWTDGVNLDKFNKAIEGGMEVEQAAFETVTGKWAKEHGFTNVEVIQNIKMKSGKSGSVKVHFTKPKTN